VAAAVCNPPHDGNLKPVRRVNRTRLNMQCATGRILRTAGLGPDRPSHRLATPVARSIAAHYLPLQGDLDLGTNQDATRADVPRYSQATIMPSTIVSVPSNTICLMTSSPGKGCTT
jgi:hypothetical protein